MPPLKSFETLLDELIDTDIAAAIERERYEPEQLDFIMSQED